MLCKSFVMKTEEYVICDTNVWYRLGEPGMYSKIEGYLEGRKLLITQLSYFELMTSRKLINNFEAVKFANNAINKYATVSLKNDIEQVLLELNVPFYKSEAVYVKNVINEINSSVIGVADFDSIKINLKQEISRREEKTEKIASEYQNKIECWRKKKNISKKHIRKCVVMQLKKDVMLYLFRHRMLSFPAIAKVLCKNSISVVFDLYVTCFTEFLWNLVQSNGSNKMVFKPNDYVDFRNLLFCTHDSKYLTLENATSQKIGGMLHRYGGKYELENAEEIKNILNS